MLACALAASSGCSSEQSGSDPASSTTDGVKLAGGEGRFIDLDSLPSIDPIEAAEVFIQRLPEPTEHDENVALHVELAPPANQELSRSLVRVIGTPESPLVLFRSDALVELGRLSDSPGPEFFTMFVRLDQRQLERRRDNEERLARGELGETSERTIVFDGRTPVAVTTGIALDLDQFDRGTAIPLGTCPLTPISDLAAWGESLMMTDPAVVLDRDRTWDPCTGAGTRGGRWTFAHLVREMALTSGHSAEDFVLEWLTFWLNDYVVNNDLVDERRLNMFNQVIAPWAAASGVSANLIFNPIKNRFEAQLGGPLDLDIAPFRLLAIVNRIDLGRTVNGTSGYGGTTTSQPVDAGELRFVFGVTEPNPWGAGSEATCNLKPFTVIFEYGVPIEGCTNVVNWAQQWTALNTFGGFTSAYLAHLEGLTESVVRSGAAPLKGNQSALNQIRTNENALHPIWELREFTLTDEDPINGTDLPSSGLLRAHTVAQTPDDLAHPGIGDPAVNAYVLGPVLSSVPFPAGPLPQNCSASYTVPYFFGGREFRGGNSLVPPTHWEAFGVNPLSQEEVCARHQFSVNTCDGCHFGDTQTFFTHISPTSGIPAALSNFLTGGPGMAFAVPDTQFGAPLWPFADLDRRFRRLYEIAFCTECTTRLSVRSDFLQAIADTARVVPIDPIGPISGPDFPVGPIVDLRTVEAILDLRGEFVDPSLIEDMAVDAIRKGESFVH